MLPLAVSNQLSYKAVASSWLTACSALFRAESERKGPNYEQTSSFVQCSAQTLPFQQKGSDDKMRMKCRPSWTRGFHSAPLTMHLSQHFSPWWTLAVIEVVSAGPFCQVKHSKEPVTRKPQSSHALLRPCPPHVLPKLAWMAGVISGDE